MRRRLAQTVLAAALTAGALAVAGCGEKQEQTGPVKPERFTLLLDYFPNADHAPIYAAQANGRFRELGLDVQIRTPSDPSAPAYLTFSWGAYQGFKAACTSLTVAYQLFKPNGEPIRADVRMTLKQTEPASTASAPSANQGGNPTTQALPGVGVHTVQEGDSLPGIAYKAYGDATRWRTIAEANGVDNPFHLRRGTPLTLPKLEA